MGKSLAATLSIFYNFVREHVFMKRFGPNYLKAIGLDSIYKYFLKANIQSAQRPDLRVQKGAHSLHTYASTLLIREMEEHSQWVVLGQRFSCERSSDARVDLI